jgi:hypothetical protein
MKGYRIGELPCSHKDIIDLERLKENLHATVKPNV